MPALRHAFRDPALLDLALTHASAGTHADNERLELLGDAVLDLVVAEDLFRALPDAAEGDLSELKAWLVSRHTLADAARRAGLDERARVGHGLRGRALPRSVLANLYEAVLGAVYLDAGLDASVAFVRTTLGDALDRARERRRGPNPKQVLQERCQRATGEPPKYALLESRGASHVRAFRVRAELDGRAMPAAWGRTRKEAERWAAHEALLALDAEGAA